MTSHPSLLPSHAKKIEIKVTEVRLSEYVKYDDIGALMRGQSEPAKSTRLAHETHNEVNPRINVVIELCEDAAFVAPRIAGFFGVSFLCKNLRASEAGRFQEKGSRQFQGTTSAPTVSFFVAGLPAPARQRHRNLGVKPFKHAQRALVDQSHKQP